jgi:hypothetical protein
VCLVFAFCFAVTNADFVLQPPQIDDALPARRRVARSLLLHMTPGAAEQDRVDIRLIDVRVRYLGHPLLHSDIAQFMHISAGGHELTSGIIRQVQIYSSSKLLRDKTILPPRRSSYVPGALSSTRARIAHRHITPAAMLMTHAVLTGVGTINLGRSERHQYFTFNEA